MRLFSQDAKLRALKRAPLFEGLSRKELTELARVSEDLEFPEGRVLCREGDVGHEFFVIVDGDVEVTRKGRKVAAEHSGDFFGEIALVEPRTPRMATVTAKTPVRCFVLTRQAFMAMIEANPSVERKVLRALARRVVELSRNPTLT
jgi:CRP-like cAMP-binding protein